MGQLPIMAADKTKPGRGWGTLGSKAHVGRSEQCGPKRETAPGQDMRMEKPGGGTQGRTWLIQRSWGGGHSSGKGPVAGVKALPDKSLFWPPHHTKTLYHMSSCPSFSPHNRAVSS